MAVIRFCYQCRHSTYEENKGQFPPSHKVCLYCDVIKKRIPKDAPACFHSFVPEDKNNPAIHIASHYDSRCKK